MPIPLGDDHRGAWAIGHEIKFGRVEVDAISGGKWRHSMSGTMSAAMRFEDHLGPVAPGAPGGPEQPTPKAPSTATMLPGQADRAMIGDLVERMRVSVVEATLATDLSTKVELWESYRRARAEALAMLRPASDTPGTRRLRSI